MALIVLIAPNEEIAKVAISAKQKYGLDMDIHIGTMDESVEIAKKLIKEGTKVFISRGGTAILIRNKLNEQVVEIKMVLDDAVCAISEAKNMVTISDFWLFPISCRDLIHWDHLWD